MRDVGSHNFIKSSASADAVLVPQPSPSPHDPLVNLDLRILQASMNWGIWDLANSL